MIEQASLDRFIGGLRAHLDILEQHRAYTDRFIGDGFNLFDFIGYDENNLSDVIARLLDPVGGHGQGTTFLSGFLNLSAAKADRGGTENAFTLLLQAVARQEKVHVRREHATSGGRFIDIIVHVGPFRFAIENKPRAADQDKQISDYVEHLKHSAAHNWAFLYLNGYGAPPSHASLAPDLRRELLESGNYVEWDYASDLAQWLQQSALASEADKIRWFLKDFRTYVLREFASIYNGENENVG